MTRRAARTATLIALPAALLAGGLSVWLLGGLRHTAAPRSTATGTPAATGPVSVAAVRLDPAAAATCRQLMASLPQRVRGAARRPVSAGSDQNAAYGTPALTVACGGPPPSLDPTDEVFSISGVCWFGRAQDAGTAWTTVDRRVPVRVTVPGPAEGSAQWIAPLSPIVGSTIDVSTAAPSGCR